jgi:trk system potassium uptake protein TrkA
MASKIENILILGVGGIGFYLAKRLTQEGYTVTAIESNTELINNANDALDAKIIEGNAMQIGYWKQAQAAKIDLSIAVTDNDAVNMVASFIADKFEIDTKIARVRSMEYGDSESFLKKEDFNIDLVIHPEELVAQEIARLVMRSSANDVVDVGEGEIKVMSVRVDTNSPLVNKTIQDISATFNDFKYRIVAIARGINTLIPRGDDTILPYDQVFFILKRDHMPSLLETLGIEQHRVQRIMLVGGGMVGRRVAQLLEKKFNVKLIEKNPAKAERLASILTGTEVLQGDGTDADALVLAGLLDTDTYISTTGDNETNIIGCLLAKHIMNRTNVDPKGTQGKTIALVNKEDYLVLAATIGLDVALNTKISAANEILKFIRRSELLSVAHLHGVDAEVVEFVASPKSPITKKPLRKLENVMREKGLLIGGLYRGSGWIIAEGDTEIQAYERVIVICKSTSLKQARQLFA